MDFVIEFIDNIGINSNKDSNLDNFLLHQATSANKACDCVIVPAFDGENCKDKSLQSINAVLKTQDFDCKIGNTLLLHHNFAVNSAIAAKNKSEASATKLSRVILTGCGNAKNLAAKDFTKTIKSAVNTLATTNATTAICFLTALSVESRDNFWKIQQAVIAAQDSLYSFETYKSKKIAANRKLKKIIFAVSGELASTKNELNQALQTGINISKSMSYTKDLANTPGNICNPSYLAKEASNLSKKYKNLSCSILDKPAMQKLGMGAFLSVTEGSAQPPKLIVLEYNGAKSRSTMTNKTSSKAKVDAKNNAPIVLVGKGITFDTGGSSLKSPANMIGMKYDMSGAATVLSLMLFAAETKLPINLIGIMACAENMPGGTASRPDDIVTSMAGITIEIANTDAEGRLVLCDALTYCKRFNPKAVIDIATLTGACVIALGHHHSGLFSNNDKLAQELLDAGNISGDKCWQMPISDEYQSQLDSPHADVVNVGGPDAGSITGACFLSRFTKELSWAHLDIAGTATGKNKVATGRPVPMLAEYLLAQAKHG